MVERKKIADPNVRDGIASLLEMEDLSLELPVAKTTVWTKRFSRVTHRRLAGSTDLASLLINL